METERKESYAASRAINRFNDRLRELQQNERDMREELLYLQAELDNFRRMADRDSTALRRDGEQALLRQLVPVAGLLESAILTARQEENDPMAVGLEMISKQLSGVFQKFSMNMAANPVPHSNRVPVDTAEE